MTTEQRVRLTAPAVAFDEHGTRALARAYWLEVERLLHGLVRVREREGRVEIRLLPYGPALIRLGQARWIVEPGRVVCRWQIEGGLLTRVPAGALTLEQLAVEGGDAFELRSAVAGFHPRLAARPGFPGWTGVLYARFQARIHDAVGRSFLARLAGGEAR